MRSRRVAVSGEQRGARLDHEQREVAGRTGTPHAVERLGRDPRPDRDVAAPAVLPDVVQAARRAGPRRGRAICRGRLGDHAILVVSTRSADHPAAARRAQVHVDRGPMVRVALRAARTSVHPEMQRAEDPERGRAPRARARPDRSGGSRGTHPGSDRSTPSSSGSSSALGGLELGGAAGGIPRRVATRQRRSTSVAVPGRDRWADPASSALDQRTRSREVVDRRERVRRSARIEAVLGRKARLVGEAHRRVRSSAAARRPAGRCACPVSRCSALRTRVRNSSAPLERLRSPSADQPGLLERRSPARVRASRRRDVAQAASALLHVRAPAAPPPNRTARCRSPRPRRGRAAKEPGSSRDAAQRRLVAAAHKRRSPASEPGVEHRRRRVESLVGDASRPRPGCGRRGRPRARRPTAGTGTGRRSPTPSAAGRRGASSRSTSEHGASCPRGRTRRAPRAPSAARGGAATEKTADERRVHQLAAPPSRPQAVVARRSTRGPAPPARPSAARGSRRCRSFDRRHALRPPRRPPQTASGPISPVRIRITCSASVIQILPSPIFPVRAAFTIASTTPWASSSAHEDLDAHLRDEVHLVLGAPVDLGVAPLAPEPLDVGGGEPLRRRRRAGPPSPRPGDGV